MTAKTYRQGFIQRTQEARVRVGMTQDEMAKKLGISQGTYKNYERNRPLPHEFVRPFCDECGIDPTDLYPISAKKQRRMS